MPNKVIGNGSNPGSYSFNASAKTVTLSGVNLKVQNILNITNLTKSAIIYNPFVAGTGFTSFTNGVLTLVFDTTSHSDTDILLITYNDDDEQQSTMVDIAFELRALYNVLANPIYVEAGGMKLNSNSNISTVSTVTSITSVGNIISLGFIPAQQAITDRLLNNEFDQVRKLFT